MKKIMPFFIMLLFLLPLQSQEKEEEIEPKNETESYQNVYTEITLEDFETTEYSKDNIKFRKIRYQDANAQIREQFPAPFNNSKKYLGVKVKGKLGDSFQVFLTKPLEINKYAQSVSIWVYGKNFSGDLSFIVQDAENNTHSLSLGKTNFLGWKKITVNLGKNIKQQDAFLEQEKTLKILYIQYKPANKSIHPQWQYFYIDDITATVREKYKDSQSDDW
ncbi:MAG: flagellar filament outer layer protein FlaA [Spirochaetota bacterium]